MAPLRLEPASPAPLAGRPLRIGYLSADFRCHAMGGLIHGLFAHHDRYTRSVARLICDDGIDVLVDSCNCTISATPPRPEPPSSMGSWPTPG
jgi:predicted O-linked N-acetylglucosamine transferase (SPINDLY family)